MENLAELNIHCHKFFQPYFTLSISLKELTIHATIYPTSGSLTMLHNKKDYNLENWATGGFSLPNLNITLDNSWYSAQAWYVGLLLTAWARWNSQIPAGHVACLKLYSS